MRNTFSDNDWERLKPQANILMPDGKSYKPNPIWDNFKKLSGNPNDDNVADTMAQSGLYPPFYPSIITDPAIKQTEEYCLMTVLALYWNNWNVYQNVYGNTERNRFIDNRNWSNGKQDMQAFMGGKKPMNNTDKNPLMKHLDFDPVTQQSKYRDIVVGYLEDLDFDIFATSLNPDAQAKKQNEYLNELVNLRNRHFNKQMDEKAGVQVSPQSNLKFPVTDESELDLYYQLGGAKEIFELQIELANQVVLNDSEFRDIKKMLLEDAFDTGRMIVDVIYDKDGRIKVKYVDPVNCGVEDYRGHYLKRPSKIWYMELKTVQQILMESHGQFSMEDMITICRMFENKFGNPVWNQSYVGWQTYVNTDATYAYFFYNWQIPVMYARWEEVDIYELINYKNANGIPIKTFLPHGKAAADYIRELPQYGPYAPYVPVVDDENQTEVPGLGGEVNTERLQYHRQYQATWIVNTKYIYDYGRVPFQARDPFNPRYTSCSTKYYRITQQPHAERIKPYVKKILLTAQKMDNVVARLKPPGWEIDISALENLTLGNGEKFTLKHNMEMWNETGDLLVKRKASGDILNQSKVESFVRPLSQADFFNYMQGLLAYINYCQGQIVDMTGLNEYMDASNPNPNTPVALARQAQQGTKNSLSQISSGFLYLCEKIALDVSDRVRLVVEATGEYSGYADALGGGLLDATSMKRVTKAVIPHRFGIKVQARATRAEREQFEQYVNQAFSNTATPEQGGLWVTDAMLITKRLRSGVNMELLRLEMNAIIKNRLAFLQKQRQDLIAQQTQGNKDAQAAAQDAATKAKQEETRLQMLLTSHNTDEAIRLAQATANIKGSVKLMTDRNKSDLKLREQMLGETIND